MIDTSSTAANYQTRTESSFKSVEKFLKSCAYEYYWNVAISYNQEYLFYIDFMSCN